MRGQPVMRALTGYDHRNHHEAKINSHPVYATTRSGPEPGLTDKARRADLGAGFVTSRCQDLWIGPG